MIKTLYAAAPWFGGALTLTVVGMLVYLHIFGEATVPRPIRWGDPPRVFVCEDAPDWVEETLAGPGVGTSYWHDVAGVESTFAPGRISCGMCETEDGPIPCKEGAIVVTLIASFVDADHAGETVTRSEGEKILSATVFVPAEYLTSGEWLPPEDIEALIMAHELGHALGFGHTRTEILGGCASARKTGHIMHPDIKSVGWLW